MTSTSPSRRLCHSLHGPCSALAQPVARAPRSSACVSHLRLQPASPLRTQFLTQPVPPRPCNSARPPCPFVCPPTCVSASRAPLGRLPRSYTHSSRPPMYCRTHSPPRQTCRSHSYGPCSALFVHSKPPLAPTELSTRCIVRRFSPAYPQRRVRILLHSVAIAIVSLQVDLQTTRTRTALTGSNLQVGSAEECEYSMQQAS